MKTLICGLQWGDEGKGRISCELAKDADWSVKFCGGPNAGHTSWYEGKEYKLHHLPAGAPMGKKVAIDTGAVIDTEILGKEIELTGIKRENLSFLRMYISYSHIKKNKMQRVVGLEPLKEE